jgi:tryptophanyl-tRNA synthetase
MTQFKDKAQKTGAEGQLVGLYDYPVLMAADILLYDADEVPVGEDQKQHVELTRDIATRFNNLYGHTFTVPKPLVQSEGARIMDLQDPSRKMSKSDADLSGCILLLDETSNIEKKIMRAVTDSGDRVSSGIDKPAVTNLLVIMSVMSGDSIELLEQKYADKGYADFKKDLAALVVSKLEPLQRAFKDNLDNTERVYEVLEVGKSKATAIADSKLEDVKSRVGLF